MAFALWSLLVHFSESIRGREFRSRRIGNCNPKSQLRISKSAIQNCLIQPRKITNQQHTHLCDAIELCLCTLATFTKRGALVGSNPCLLCFPSAASTRGSNIVNPYPEMRFKSRLTGLHEQSRSSSGMFGSWLGGDAVGVKALRKEAV